MKENFIKFKQFNKSSGKQGIVVIVIKNNKYNVMNVDDSKKFSILR